MTTAGPASTPASTPASALAVALSILLAAAVAAPARAQSQAAEVEDVASPRGETTRILIEKADKPWATAVLFAGSNGGMALTTSGDIGELKGNFLIRSRSNFWYYGIHTVVIDAPSDRGALTGFRSTEAHAQDVGAVIRHLRAKFKLPVWLIGTSNGTTSAANAGARLAGDSRPDGLVLTASRLATTIHAASLLDIAIDKITGPVLIVHHKNDNCGVTPPGRVGDLKAALTGAKPVKVLWYDGGGRVRGDVCGAYHYHGFRGLETDVIDAIAAWMQNPMP